jgi:hypothetical protein
MAGLKFWAHGTQVDVDSTTIKGLTALTLPEPARGQVDTTDTDSDGVREFVAGILDEGEFGMEGHRIFGDPGQALLRANARQPNAVVGVVITLPAQAGDDTAPITVSFDAFVLTPPGGTLPLVDETAAGFSATMKVTGAVTVSTESI